MRFQVNEEILDQFAAASWEQKLVGLLEQAGFGGKGEMTPSWLDLLLLCRFIRIMVTIRASSAMANLTSLVVHCAALRHYHAGFSQPITETQAGTGGHTGH